MTQVEAPKTEGTKEATELEDEDRDFVSALEDYFVGDKGPHQNVQPNSGRDQGNQSALIEEPKKQSSMDELLHRISAWSLEDVKTRAATDAEEKKKAAPAEERMAPGTATSKKINQYVAENMNLERRKKVKLVGIE